MHVQDLAILEYQNNGGEIHACMCSNATTSHMQGSEKFVNTRPAALSEVANCLAPAVSIRNWIVLACGGMW